MNTATKKNVPALADSVKVVAEEVKAYMAKFNVTISAAVVTGIINERIHDETLFTKAQRPAAVKALNKELGTKHSLTQLKRAVKPLPTAKAAHVDGLSGTASLPGKPAGEKKPAEASAPAAAAKPAGKATDPNFVLVDSEQKPVKETINATQELTQENTMTDQPTLAHRLGATAAGAAERAAKAENVTADPLATNTNTAAEAVRETPGALNGTEYELILTQAGIATDEQLTKFVQHFFSNHATLAPSFQAVAEQNPTFTNRALFGIWVALSEENSMAFMAFAKAKIETNTPVAKTSFTDKIATTLRGDRKEGFSSGTVAALAAVAGGTLEMAMRGSVTIGSTLGTAVGATAGYFAAEATDGLMKSETGRYIVAGSIGFAAGGLGSRLGRVAGDALKLDDRAGEVISSLPDMRRQAPAATDAPVPNGAVGLF